MTPTVREAYRRAAGPLGGMTLDLGGRPEGRVQVAVIRAFCRMAEERRGPVVEWRLWVGSQVDAQAHFGGAFFEHHRWLKLPEAK